MSIYELNQVLDIPSQEGIWLEERENHWYFMIQDETWCPEEMKAIKNRASKIHFLVKKEVPLFLVQIEDVLECSDIPAYLSDFHYNPKKTFFYHFVFIDGNKKVIAIRSGQFNSSFNAILPNFSLREEEFEKRYLLLRQEKEPYEWEEEALFEQIDEKEDVLCGL
ncbi:hypothetical protein [Bulleidia sp. zg-1006]|uniref:hypothetical protein n=1 Tax=Bulleidia sp. zg-1006 TaxID=2806552 RepID=UPI00193AC6C2|nr:hypothetical protein [Bulleidia sp. zg-1006]QRG87420.1 hypothetical protein JOS54_03685 [Bulleidia sp. zg-1006]